MNLNDLKSSFDQLTDWLPESRETAEPQDNSDWVGWDSWVDVEQQAGRTKAASASRPISGIRPGSEGDLDAINRVIEHCVMSWNIPDRVKRLSLSSYRYNAIDLKHFRLFVAYDQTNRIIGVAALEDIESPIKQKGKAALLLHGIYVDPAAHCRGIGKQLVRKVMQIAKSEKRSGLLVKAQPDAIGFFKALHFKPVQTTDANRDYPHQLWLSA